jgi:uncharacterized protein YcfJ
MSMFRPLVCSVALLAALSGCVQPPLGPTVAVMPAKDKPFEVFAGEQATCKQYADQQVAGGAEAADNRQFGDAVLGTVLGAALGAAIGGGRGAAIGAGSGAILGTAAGAGYGAHTQRGLQFEYNNAYAQCMVAHGNAIVPPPVRYAVPVYPVPVYPVPGYAYVP